MEKLELSEIRKSLSLFNEPPLSPCDFNIYTMQQSLTNRRLQMIISSPATRPCYSGRSWPPTALHHRLNDTIRCRKWSCPSRLCTDTLTFMNWPRITETKDNRAGESADIGNGLEIISCSRRLHYHLSWRKSYSGQMYGSGEYRWFDFKLKKSK